MIRPWMIAGAVLVAGCGRDRELGRCSDYEPGREVDRAFAESNASSAIVGASAQYAGAAFALELQLRSTCRRFGVDLGVTLQDLANSPVPCALTAAAIRRERAGAKAGPYPPVVCIASSSDRDRCLARCVPKTGDCDIACDALSRARAICTTPTVQAGGAGDRLRVALEGSYGLVLLMRARAVQMPSPALRSVLDHVNDVYDARCIPTFERNQEEADRSIADSLASLDAVISAVEGP